MRIDSFFFEYLIFSKLTFILIFLGLVLSAYRRKVNHVYTDFSEKDILIEAGTKKSKPNTSEQAKP